MPAVPVPVIVICILGGWNFGIAADLLLQGIVFAQISHYIALYKKDILALRAFVWGLLFLTTLKTAQILTIMWTQNVVNFTDIGAATAMFYTFWASKATLILVGLIAFYVQLFFCQRLWALSKNVYLVALLIALFVFGLVAAIVKVRRVLSAIRGSQRISRLSWLEICFCAEAPRFTYSSPALYATSDDQFSWAETVEGSSAANIEYAGQLPKITFQSAAPAAICALLNLLGSQSGKTTSQSASIAEAVRDLRNVDAQLAQRDPARTRAGADHEQQRSAERAAAYEQHRARRAVAPRHRSDPVRTHVQTMQQSDTDMFSPKTHMDDLSERDDQESKN
ncbi:hypothetical protein B0H13DRAFT_1910589 [Mycena leptocephala]|nr:hypothetical protein B0H13DRAFT_1910589 [Mycena leptocephala]